MISVIDSVFLRVVFSRIFSRFSSSLVCAKEKGVSPLPALPSPEKDKAPRFCCASLATRWVFLRTRGESLAFPCLGKTSLGFFGVVDCVIDLDSKKLDSVALDSESARDSVFSYKFARQTWYRGLG